MFAHQEQERPLRNRQNIFGRNGLGGAMAVVISALALSGCVTEPAKVKETAETAPQPTADEQLAASLNAKADANARKPGGYRDPLVRSASASGMQMAGGQPTTLAGGSSAQPPLPGSAMSGPTGIAGLVTQPTGVNANRTSIYSMPVAAQPYAMPGAPVSAYAAGPQDSAPQLRNVYSAPPAPPTAPMPQAEITAPAAAKQMSQNAEPAPSPQQPPLSVASAFKGRPTADATPSHVLPAPGSKTRKLDSQEALMIARSLASKGQDQSGSGGVVMKPGSAAMMMTPGMAASLKDPIAYANDGRPPIMNAIYGSKDKVNGAPPVQFASLPAMTRGAMQGIELQNDQVQIGCFKSNLMSKLKGVEAHFGRPVIVTSGYRDPEHNHEIGGTRESLHMSCEAADIQVSGVPKAELASYLRSLPDRGGVGTYCRTESVHVDTGTPRDWNWGCNRT
jgi:uncharacterized protein YcbK (DUF882 family)